MENIYIETRAIGMRYNKFSALTNVNLSLRQGRIYGFIGENGAGKSTFLRIITGLAMPTEGELVLFGNSTKRGLEIERKRIGSTIEEPALYLEYTAEMNLELQRILVGNPDNGITEKMLRTVGLSDNKKKKVKDFSTGMKQRLGIALSLIGNPKILLLDEPVNGLDPKGIADLRLILQKLKKKKKITIIVSSHILNELYLLATDYIIIHRGRIIETLTHDELTEKCKKYIAIQMDDVTTGVAAIERELKTEDYKVMETGMVHLYSYANDTSTVAKILQKSGILVTHISVCVQSLEEYYFSITGGDSYE
jgi:ABC-2 type transport system ATP-binding protein